MPALFEGINMSEYKEITDSIVSVIDKYKSELEGLNDDLADHPELSGEEYETSRKIVELLNGKGYEVEYPFAGLPTAFKGVYGNDNHKHKVAIMTEYDALPDIGHACGHCLSGSISILAGLSLAKLQDELDTDIHIVGTPVEETDGAKCAMVKSGVFDNYDMALMIHLYDENIVDPKLLALDSYMYNFHGKAAHASAAPWDGINAFNAAQLMFHGIDMLRQHVTPDVRMHGIIRHGGEAPNIVPEEVDAEVYIRALDRNYLNNLVKKVDNCAEAGALATQAKWDKYETASPYDNLKYNKTGSDAIKEAYTELGVPLNGDPDRIFGSSDAGNVSFVCPAFQPCLQVVDHGVPIHTREFAEQMKTDRAHETLATGAKIIAFSIAKLFSDDDKIKSMKEDFERS